MAVEASHGAGPDVGRAREAALEMLDDAPEGEGLDAKAAALVAFAVAATPATLDREGIDRHSRAALDAGATLEELSEAMLLAAGIGLHGMHEAPQVLRDVLESRGDALPELAPDDERYRERLLADPYWQRLDSRLPGFLEGALRLSPTAFRLFVDFVAVPWQEGPLPAKLKELIYVSIDTMPAHRYLPGCVSISRTPSGSARHGRKSSTSSTSLPQPARRVASSSSVSGAGRSKSRSARP